GPGPVDQATRRRSAWRRLFAIGHHLAAAREARALFDVERCRADVADEFAAFPDLDLATSMHGRDDATQDLDLVSVDAVPLHHAGLRDFEHAAYPYVATHGAVDPDPPFGVEFAHHRRAAVHVRERFAALAVALGFPGSSEHASLLQNVASCA